MYIFNFTGFSSVIQMLKTYRNMLDIMGNVDLTLLLSSKEPNRKTNKESPTTRITLI